MAELYELTITEAGELLRQREISSVELTRAHLDRIRAVDDKVKAFTLVTDELALQQAEEADRRFKQGSTVSPLTGIPIAIKDVICTKGITTTCGSYMLKDFKPPYDATVMERLNAAGIVMVGKTNMDELAMGSYGSDTGGSIRQPGSLCNVVGLKPTYGRVSRSGLVAFASSLDQIGPITKDVTDAAMLLNVIAGHDPLDSTSADVPVPDYTKALKKKDVKKLKIGLPKEYFAEGLDQEVEQAVREAAGELKKLGGEIKDVTLPTTGAAIAAYYLIATAEASSNLARYDGVKYGLRSKQTKDLLEMYMKTRQEGFGPEVKRRIMLGTYALSAGYYEAYYGKAQKVRTLVIRDYEQAFGSFDVIVTPVTPTPAFKFGAKGDDPLQMYLA